MYANSYKGMYAHSHRNNFCLSRSNVSKTAANHTPQIENSFILLCSMVSQLTVDSEVIHSSTCSVAREWHLSEPSHCLINFIALNYENWLVWKICKINISFVVALRDEGILQETNERIIFLTFPSK